MELACDASLKNRHYESNGQLRIERTPISKATVNPYYGKEIPNSVELGLQPERTYYMLRDPGELAKAAPSFRTKELMFLHTEVNADDPKQEHIAGTIGSNVTFEAPYLIADMCIWDVEAIAGVETDTIRELSASYSYRADMTPGMYEGQRYDGVMRDIQGNHVALVKKGRAGSDVMAADSELEKTMETKFGKALYAILCAASPKLAQDSALKPLVIGLSRKQCDLRALEPKLLAMDAALRIDSARMAMDAVKEDEGEERPKAKDRIARDAQTSEERATWAQMRKDGSADDPADDSMPASLRKASDGKKAKDGKTAKDLSFEEWAKEDEGESDHKAKDGEEESLEEKKARYEREKRRADDSEEETEEERKERLAKRASDKKAKDCTAKDAEEKEIDKKAEDKMKHAMDEFKAELREAEDARRLVRPLVGEVLAFDSAPEILGFTLDHFKVGHKGVTSTAGLTSMVEQLLQANKPAPRIAMDSASLQISKIPGFDRVRVM